MANPYEFKTALGDNYIPIADGEYEISDMSASYNTGQCYLQFHDSEKNPVTPDAGTVSFISGPFTGQWLGSSNRIITIDADTVLAGDDGVATYTVPQFDGCVVHTKMTLADIAGAAYVTAFHWRA